MCEERQHHRQKSIFSLFERGIHDQSRCSVCTGCVPGVATRYLARKGAKVCACIGAGPVSKACFGAIALEVKELEGVIVCDLFIEKSEAFAKEMAEKYNLKAVGRSLFELTRKA